jgi:hypothetical protein
MTDPVPGLPAGRDGALCGEATPPEEVEAGGDVFAGVFPVGFEEGGVPCGRASGRSWICGRPGSLLTFRVSSVPGGSGPLARTSTVALPTDRRSTLFGRLASTLARSSVPGSRRRESPPDLTVREAASVAIAPTMDDVSSIQSKPVFTANKCRNHRNMTLAQTK